MRAIWILLVTVLVGCTASGGYVPVAPIKMKKDMVAEYTVPASIYVEPIIGRGSISDKFIYQQKEVSVVLNLDEMSTYVANSLNAELVKKGAELNKEADKVIQVEVIAASMTYSKTYQVEGTLEFKLSNGYAGSCRFGGTGVKASRALGGALQWGVANIINHNDVHSFLLEQDTLAHQEIPEAENMSGVQGYDIKARYKLAVLPFQADKFEDTSKYQERAVASIIASLKVSKDIVLTHSCYPLGDDNTEKTQIIEIDNSLNNGGAIDIWDKDTLYEEKVFQYASKLNVDLVFTCKVSCKKTGMFAVCGSMIIEPYLVYIADSRIFHKTTSMQIEMPGNQVPLKRDYYSRDDFYFELEKASTLLFQEFLNTNPDLPVKKSLIVQ